MPFDTKNVQQNNQNLSNHKNNYNLFKWIKWVGPNSIDKKIRN